MLCIEKYIDKICSGLNLPDEELEAIREEIECHLLDAAASKKTEEISEEEAITAAIKDVGDPEELRSHYRNAYLKQHMMRIFSRVAGIGVLAWTLYYSFAYINASMDIYFNPLAFLLAPVGATILLLGSFSIRDLGQALAAPFRLYLKSGSLRWGMVEALYRTWAVYMLGCGIFAAAFGAYLTCFLIDNSLPIGPGLALAMMGLIYGTVLSGVLWTFALSLPKARWAPKKKKHSRFQAIAAMGVFLVIVGLTWRQISLPCQPRHIFLPAGLCVLIGTAGLSVATFSFQGCTKIFQEPAKLRIIGAYFGIIGLLGFVNHVVLGLAIHTSMNKLHLGIATALLLLLYGLLSGLFCLVLAGALSPAKQRSQTHLMRRLRPSSDIR